MKKRFTKQVLIHIGITYLLMIIAFFIGFITYSCSDFLCFGPGLDGLISVIISAPVILIVGSILVNKQKDNGAKKPVGTYLLSTLGMFVLIIILLICGAIIKKNIETSKLKKMNEERAQFINATIADEIHKVYPNAEIRMPYFTDITSVDLKGYKYENLPDFDLEISKWKELKNTNALSNYPYEIVVDYFFDDLYHSFATIRIDDFYMNYSSLGMSPEGVGIVKNQIKEFLNSYHINSNFYDRGNYNDYRCIVIINRKLSLEERTDQELLWNEFINKYNINTKLVDITAYYKDPANESNVLYYEVSNNHWYGGYDN